MSNTEITMDELIQYLEGKASDILIRRIEKQRSEDEEFGEEMDEWESRLNEEEDKEAFFQQMKMMEEAWQSTDLSHLIQEYEKSEKEGLVIARNIKFPSWVPIAIAAAIALIILSVFVLNSNSSNTGINTQQQLAQELNSKVAILIGPEAAVGNSSEGKSFKMQAWEAFERGEFEESLRMVDSMISNDPLNADNYLLKGLIYEKFGKSAEALKMLEQTSQMDTEDLPVTCESLWYMMLIFAKDGESSQFSETFNRWKNGKCGQLDAGRLGQLNQIQKTLK
ncbi:MAG: hypothetical protein MRZ79_00655 [Bacteroidia bacterium]|nr:hypothetical protein [Bacteroidia bacterium]